MVEIVVMLFHLQTIADPFGNGGETWPIVRPWMPTPRHDSVYRIWASRGFLKTATGRYH